MVGVTLALVCESSVVKGMRSVGLVVPSFSCFTSSSSRNTKKGLEEIGKRDLTDVSCDDREEENLVGGRGRRERNGGGTCDRLAGRERNWERDRAGNFLELEVAREGVSS